MRLQLARREWWTWRRAALGVAAAAIVIGGGLGATVLAGQALAAPAPVKNAAVSAQNEDQAKRGWLGITIAQLNDQLAARLGLSQTTGVVITGVMKGSPAESAGLLQKDILLKVNGADVADVKAVRDAIGAVAPGAQVTLLVQRSDGQHTITVTAGQAPERPKLGRPVGPRGGLGLPGMGLFAPRLKELEGIPPQELFSHLQGGTFTFTDKDGKPVTVTITLGTVSAVDVAASTVTVTPNAGGSATYTVGADTVIHGRARELVQLKVGDKVAVTTVNGSTEARMIVGMPEPRKAEGQRQQQRFELPGMGFGFGRGMMTPELQDRLEGLRERLQSLLPERGGRAQAEMTSRSGA